MTPLQGKIALVTGAGGGIGRALVRALAAEGATVWAVGRRRDALERTAEAVAGGRVCLWPADLTNDEQVMELASEVERAFGRLDVLIHSAGVISHGRIGEAAVGPFDAQYSTNVRAPYLLTQKLLPLLRKGPGQIAVINSSVAARPGVGQFAATQHALRAVTDTLRQEINADGIRVLSVFPGRTATSRQERLYAEEGRTYRPEVLLQPEDIARMVVAALTLPATAEVTDIHIRPMMKSY